MSASADLKKDLNTKLKMYLEMDEDVKRKPVIFTNRPELWITATKPIFVTSEPLPPIPSDYDPERVDIAQLVLDHYQSILVNEQLQSIYINAFELTVDGHTEVHLAFSPDKDTMSAEIYPKNPVQYVEPLTRSASTPNVNITIRFVRKRHCSSEDSGVGRSSTTSNFPHPSTSSAPDSDTPGLSRVNEDYENEDDQEMASVFGDDDGANSVNNGVNDGDGNTGDNSASAIGLRLSEELKKNLAEKLHIYQNRCPDAMYATLIFTDDENLWKESKQPVIVTSEPLPPIPADYDHENFDINRDVLAYVEELARTMAGCSPFHASSIRFGEKASSRIHLLFSRSAETAQFYLTCPSPERVSASPSMVTAEYRQYSCGAGAYLKVDMVFERRGSSNPVSLTLSTGSSNPLSLTFSSGSSNQDYSPDDSSNDLSSELSQSEEGMWPIMIRMGGVLVHNLSNKMKIFADRSEEAKHSAVILTDDLFLWNTEKLEPLIVLDPLPPIPLDYDHETFDITEDMTAYMKSIAKRKNIDPFYTAVLMFGEKSNLQVHFLLSQYEEKMELYCSRFNLAETEFLPSEAWSAPVIMNPAAEGTTFAKPSPAKRKRLERTKAVGSVPAKIEPSDSLEAIEDLPVDPET